MGWTAVAPWRLGAAQTIAIGASSAQNGTAFNAQSGAVMLTASVDCHVRFGSNPTALATDTLVKANIPYVFGMAMGDKLAVIQDSAAGTLYVTELTH